MGPQYLTIRACQYKVDPMANPASLLDRALIVF